MNPIVFTAQIRIRGVNPYVLVTQTLAATLRSGWRKPMPVLVRVNGEPAEPWHINMMPVGDGSFYLYLHQAIRSASQTKVGDTVKIQLSFDTDYKNGPLHEMPPELQVELGRSQRAKQSWDALPPSRQKEILRYLAGLKSEEALLRNIDKAIQVLSGDTGRFMGRDWRAGR